MNTQAQADPLQRFLSAAFMAVGGLVATLCGVCTVIATAATLPSSLSQSAADNYSAVILVMGLTIGGPPILVGGALFHAGRRWRRRGRDVAPDDLDRIASILTFIAGAVLGAGYLVLSVGIGGRLLEDLRGDRPTPGRNLGPDIGILAAWAFGAIIALVVAWGGLKRFRQAWRAP